MARARRGGQGLCEKEDEDEDRRDGRRAPASHLGAAPIMDVPPAEYVVSHDRPRPRMTWHGISSVRQR